MNKNIINKKIILFICVFILLLTIFDFIILILLSRKTIIATNVIFKNSINSIVELKAKTEGYGENFGTAFFINDDGYLITAAHVVTYKEAKKIKIYEEFYIRFATEKEYNLVKLIKFDIDKDLAYLKLSKNKNIIFESIKFKKKNIEYGEEVYAIGNGLNQGISITKGIISMPFVNIKNNDLTRNLIQVNIIVNEGNSGGAIVDLEGFLVGVVSFRIKDNYGNVVYGIAYVIPKSTIINFIEKNI